LDTVVWFAGKSGTQLTVHDARAAVGWKRNSRGLWQRGRGREVLKQQVPGSEKQSQNPWIQPRGALEPPFAASN
jgi:hypothetical protein